MFIYPIHRALLINEVSGSLEETVRNVVIYADNVVLLKRGKISANDHRSHGIISCQTVYIGKVVSSGENSAKIGQSPKPQRERTRVRKLLHGRAIRSGEEL